MVENKQNALLWAIGGALIILGVIYFSIAGNSTQTSEVEAPVVSTDDAEVILTTE